MWAFFFALFDFPEISLLLGALALYWGISSLRAKAPVSRPSVDGPAAGGTDVRTASGSGPDSGTASSAPSTTGAPAQGTTAHKPQTTAAVSGIVTASIALLIVAATFTVQLVYRDYYTCVNDALTKTGQLACNDKLPDSLVPIFGVQK